MSPAMPSWATSHPLTYELLLVRDVFSPTSTTGILTIAGLHECFTLEDPDRDLEADDPDHDGKSGGVKIKGETCIPRGRYKIIRTMSPKFGKVLPLLLNVPQFDGIRIHTGNKPAHTHGCILPGTARGLDSVSGSTAAFEQLDAKIIAALKAGRECWITIR